MFAWETIRFIFVDMLLSIVYFPVWWYTTGVKNLALAIKREILAFGKAMDLRILAKYLFQPMFGQTDVWGRIISVVLRIVVFTFKLFTAFGYSILLGALFIVWIIFPVFVVFNIIFHLGLF